jgi:hypothetical protein
LLELASQQLPELARSAIEQLPDIDSLVPEIEKTLLSRSRSWYFGWFVELGMVRSEFDAGSEFVEFELA